MTWTPQKIVILLALSLGVAVLLFPPQLPVQHDSYAYQYLMDEVRVVFTTLVMLPFAVIIAALYLRWRGDG